MNFLVIGVGSSGQRHLRVLQNLVGSNNKVFAYRGEHKRGLISEDLQSEDFDIDPIEFYGANEINQIGELSKMSWDLTIIATPPSSHLEYFQKVINASNRLLIEKPIATSLTAALKIRQYAIQSEKPVYVGYQMSFHRIVNLINEWIETIGMIKKCQTQFREHIDDMNPFRSMQSHHLSSPDGGGALLALSHDIDMIFMVLGANEFKTCRFMNIKLNEKKAMVECELTAEIINDKGVIFLESYFSVMAGPKIRNSIIVGDLGSIEWNSITGEFFVRNSNRTVIFSQALTFEKYRMYCQQIDFLLGLDTLNQVCLDNLNRSIAISSMNDLLCKKF